MRQTFLATAGGEVMAGQDQVQEQVHTDRESDVSDVKNMCSLCQGLSKHENSR